MSRNAWRGTKTAVVFVSAAMLFGVLGSEAAAPAVAAVVSPSPDPHGLCNLEETVQQRAESGGKPGICLPLDGSATGKRLKELATDPSGGGGITSGSMQKARAALGLENAGLLPAPVRHDPTGAADFIDGRGTSWNAYDATKFSLHQGGHDLRTSMVGIGVDLLSGQNVILITENLSTRATSELKSAVDSAGLRDRVLLWPGVSASS
jgi:hypothetical protein